MNDGLFVRWCADDEAFTGFVRDVNMDLTALTWQASTVLIYRLI